VGAGCGAGAGPSWGSEMGTGKEPSAQPSRPISSAPLLPPLSVAKWFFQGVPIWLTLGAVLCDLRLGRSPSRSLSPAGQGQPGTEQRGRGLLPHTRSVRPSLFGVPYSAPPSPLRVLPSAAPAGPLHVAALCPHPMVHSVGLSLRRGF